MLLSVQAGANLLLSRCLLHSLLHRGGNVPIRQLAYYLALGPQFWGSPYNKVKAAPYNLRMFMSALYIYIVTLLKYAWHVTCAEST